MAGGGDDFYACLDVIDGSEALFDTRNYKRLPDDWLVVVADVRGSTRAISDGHYRAVNIAGVSVIAAVRNLARDVELPFAFGGDGATLCIPPRLAAAARAALLATRRMVATSLGLDLRVGLVRAAALAAAGEPVLVARHRLSPTLVQTAFAGGGVAAAERLLKDDAVAGVRIEDDGRPASADYSGLECRWDNVRSPHGETIALMVEAVSDDAEARRACYGEVLHRLHAIYGDDEQCRPVRPADLHLALRPARTRDEAAVRTAGRGRAARLVYRLRMLLQNLSGAVLMRVGPDLGGVPWRRYRATLAANTDFKKFDGMLRLVVCGDSAQRAELEAVLQGLRGAGRCRYGLHVADSALVTCLVSDRVLAHQHFVDGAGGGYAEAARRFKAQRPGDGAPAMSL